MWIRLKMLILIVGEDDENVRFLSGRRCVGGVQTGPRKQQQGGESKRVFHGGLPEWLFRFGVDHGATAAG
jgi:hypothetical protein